MKKLVLSLTLLLAMISLVKAQDILPPDPKTGKATFLEVVDATGMTAKDLFKAAKDWATKKGLAITKEDESTGEILCTGNFPVDYPGVKGKPEKGNITYTFSIFIKEGKYRYIVTDFVHEGVNGSGSGGKLEAAAPACGPGRMSSASWLTIKKKTRAGMETLTGDLKRVIKEIQNDPAKKSDW